VKTALGIAIAAAFLVTALPASARFGSSSSGEPTLRITDIQLFTPKGPIDAVPAETAVGVRIFVRNGSGHTAHDVRLELNPAAGITMPYPNADYGTLSVGEVRSKAIGFEISSAQCNGPTLKIYGTLRSAETAVPIVVDVNTNCPGPRFFVRAIRYRGGNGDAIADPGERLEVFVRLENAGHDTATGIEGTLVVHGNDLTVIDAIAPWPDIPVGGVAENKEPFVIQLSENAPRRQVCGTPIVGATPEQTAATKAVPSPSYSRYPSDDVSPSPSAPAAVGFDAIVQVHSEGKTLPANFSSGYPCFSETSTSQQAVNDTSPVPAPSSRIPLFLIVVGVGVAVAIVVRARVNR
jgi:hypothetical protein